MNSIKNGQYRHYKGGVYEVMGVGRHTETLEELVVYRSVNDSDDFPQGTVWMRPATMFFDLIEIGDKIVRRFEAL